MNESIRSARLLRKGMALVLSVLLGVLAAEATLAGNGRGNSGADIDAVFLGENCTSVSVESSKDLSNVVLLFADQSWEKFDDLSGLTGEFAGTGANAGKTIVTAYVKSGSGHSESDLSGKVGKEFQSACDGPGLD